MKSRKSNIVRFLICLFAIPLWSTQHVNAQALPKLVTARVIGNEYYGGGDFNVRSIKIDAAGNRYVTGDFTGTADFDPSTNSVILTSAGITDIFLAKYDASGNYIWAKSFGGIGADVGTSIALDGSGNVYITGNFNRTVDFDPSAATAYLTSFPKRNQHGEFVEIFLAKYDGSGNYVWAKSLGGEDQNSSNSIALDGSGNVFITGYFIGTVDFDPSAATASITTGYFSKHMIFFAKYDTDGNYIWANAMGGIVAQVHVKAAGNSIALDGSGNVLITGNFDNTVDFDPSSTGTANLASAGEDDIFLAKYNASGNYVWAKAYGGIGADVGNSLALDGSGNVVVTGYFNGTADFDPSTTATVNLISAGITDIFLAKYDASGNYLWGKSLGGTLDDNASSLAMDGSGSAVVTGYFNGTVDFNTGGTTATLTSAGSTDIFLAKYDALGNYIFAKSFGGTLADNGSSLVLDGSGNVVVTGYFTSLADFDPNAGTANLQDSSIYKNGYIASYTLANGIFNSASLVGGHNDPTVQYNSTATDVNGNVLITGYFSGTVDFDPSSTSTANLTSAVGDDIFLAKYDASGNYVWAKAFGGIGADVGNSVALDGSGNVVLTGYFSVTADFNPGGTTTANFTSNGSKDIFFAKYDASGNYIWAKAIGGRSVDVGCSLALDASGNVLVTGSFSSDGRTRYVDFDPSSGSSLLNVYNNNAFLAKYDASGNYIWAKATWGIYAASGNSVALDGIGNIILTGNFVDYIDIDPSSTSTVYLTSAGGKDIFLAKYDASGNYIWATALGDIGNDSGNSLSFDGSGNLLLKGYFNITVDFDPSANTYNLAGYMGQNGFVAVYTVNNTWTGLTDNNFNTGSNWSFGTVPTSTEIFTITTGTPQLNVDYTVGGIMTISGTGTLTVNPGYTLSVAAGGTADFGGQSVTFKSSVSGTAQLGQVLGTLSNASNVTMERYISARRAFRFIAAPATTTTSIKQNWMENGTYTAGLGTQITGTGGATNGFDATNSNNASLFSFSSAAQNWVPSTHTNASLVAGDAYRLFVRGDRGIDLTNNLAIPTPTVLRTTGTPFVGTKNYTLNSTAGAWNLVGNPYQSTIDGKQVSFSNVTPKYYAWDPKMATRGAYVVYDFGGFNNIPGSQINVYLQPGQAFFVQTDVAGAASVSVSESMKASASNQTAVFQAAVAYPMLNATLHYTDSLAKNAPAMDGFRLLFDNSFSNSIDRNDAQKLTNIDENIAINQAGTLLSIEKRQLYNAATEVQISTSNYVRQQYTVQLSWNNPIDNGFQAQLVDNYTNTTTPIAFSGNTNYAYTVDNAIAASKAADRFKIVFVPNVALPVSGIELGGTATDKQVKLSFKALNEREMSD